MINNLFLKEEEERLNKKLPDIIGRYQETGINTRELAKLLISEYTDEFLNMAAKEQEQAINEMAIVCKVEYVPEKKKYIFDFRVEHLADDFGLVFDILLEDVICHKCTYNKDFLYSLNAQMIYKMSKQNVKEENSELEKIKSGSINFISKWLSYEKYQKAGFPYGVSEEGYEKWKKEGGIIINPNLIKDILNKPIIPIIPESSLPKLV